VMAFCQQLHCRCGLCGVMVERSLATQKVAGRVRISTDPLPGNCFGQAAHTHVPLLPSSIIWYRLWAVTLFGWEVYHRLDGSNGSLPPGGWLKVTCGLTACTPGSALGPTLGNEYGRTLPFFTIQVLF